MPPVVAPVPGITTKSSYVNPAGSVACCAEERSFTVTSAGPGVPGGVLAEMLVGSLAKTSLEGSTFPPMVTCTFEEKPRPEMVTRVPPVQGPCEGCRPLTANGGPEIDVHQAAAVVTELRGGRAPGVVAVGIERRSRPGQASRDRDDAGERGQRKGAAPAGARATRLGSHGLKGIRRWGSRNGSRRGCAVRHRSYGWGAMNLLPQRTLREYLTTYQQEHTKLGTKLTHMVGIPMIVASIPDRRGQPSARGWPLRGRLGPSVHRARGVREEQAVVLRRPVLPARRPRLGDCRVAELFGLPVPDDPREASPRSRARPSRSTTTNGEAAAAAS